MGQKSIQELRDMVVALQERVAKLEKRCGESKPPIVDDDPTHELPSLEQHGKEQCQQSVDLRRDDRAVRGGTRHSRRTRTTKTRLTY